MLLAPLVCDFDGFQQEISGLSTLSWESLPQIVELNYLGVLFMSEGTIKQEISQRIGAVRAEMQSLYHCDKARS